MSGLSLSCQCQQLSLHYAGSGSFDSRAGPVLVATVDDGD
jgi:hypothetical protein